MKTNHTPVVWKGAPLELGERLPEGSYRAKIVDSEVDGVLLLIFEVCDGQFKGRKLPVVLDIFSRDMKYALSGRCEMQAIAHAAGVVNLRDTSTLHDLPMIVYVVCKGKINYIHGYYRLREHTNE